MLLACCRWPRSADREAAIQREVRRGIDWTLFDKMVARHRVEGLVHDGLASAGIKPAAEVGKRINGVAAAIARQNLQFAAESMRLKARFEQAGIPFLFLKGLTLNILAYNTLAIKYASDIDVAVDPEAYSDACAIMPELGFSRLEPGPDVGPDEIPAWLARRKHTIWGNAASHVVVEVHSSIVDNPLLLPTVSVHSPQRQVAIGGGVSLPTLGKDELFAYLCVHGSAHAWSRLKWLADVAALLKDEDEAEVERLYRRSIELGGGRTAAQALILCSDLLSMPLRQDLKRELRSDRTTAYLVGLAIKSINASGPVVELDELVLGTVPIHIGHFLMGRGWQYKAREFRRKFMPVPNSPKADRGMAGALSPLYRLSGWLLSRSRKKRAMVPAARNPSKREE